MADQIICVVDNQAVPGSKLRSEHGLSLWIETKDGVLLFDTGKTKATLRHNLRKLHLSLQDVDCLALSHAHYDHTGGLEMVLSKRYGIKIFTNPDILRPRYALRDGKYQSIGLPLDPTLLVNNADLRLSAQPNQIFPDLWTTGVISKRPEPLGSSPHLLVRDDGAWRQDPYQDDMSLVLKTARGLVLICGCCHAGLLNTLIHVEDNFEGPIRMVIGGTHLVSADDQQLDHVISIIQDRYQGVDLYLNHCTGQKAIKRLSTALGDQVRSCPAGTILTFDD